MARTVVGVFDTGLAAKHAVDQLVHAGIPRADIGLVAGDPNQEYTRHGHPGEGDTPGTPGERAATGAAGGAVLGGALGLLAGIAALPIPGIGPIIAAGPIAAALTGTALGAGVGAAAGGLVGYLMGLGVPEEEAGYYSEAVRRGGTLVTVQAPEPEAERVARVLDESGARDIEGMAEEWRRQGWTGLERGAEPETPGTPRPQAIPVVREELQVGTRPVQRGGVRVYSRVTEEPVEEQVRLREEQVRVERRPVEDRPVSPGDPAAFREASIEVTETAEEPVIAKRARVVEEVLVDRDVQERTETVRDNVRRATVDVERTGGKPAPAAAAGYERFEADFRQHCAGAFAGGRPTYEECAPAYRYGHTLGSDPRSARRDWPAIEPEARRGWEAQSPGTWDRFGESVRYAWTRARDHVRAA